MLLTPINYFIQKDYRFNNKLKNFNNFNKVTAISPKTLIKTNALKRYYNYILKNQLDKLSKLPFYKEIDDLQIIKKLTYNSYKYKNNFNIVDDSVHIFECETVIDKNKTCIFTVVRHISGVKICELYYNNILYKKIAILIDHYFNSNEYKCFQNSENNVKSKINVNAKKNKITLKNQYSVIIEKIYNKTCYNNREFKTLNFKSYIQENKFHELKSKLLDCSKFILPNSSLENIYKLSEKYNLDIEYYQKHDSDKLIKKYNKHCDIIEHSLPNGDKIFECSNNRITNYGNGNSSNYILKKTFQFIKSTNPLRLTKFINEKNKEEVTINNNNNYLVEILIDNMNKDLNNLMVYKFASVIYNNIKHTCLIEMELPRNAQVASDGGIKYRCNKLIPRKVFIKNRYDYNSLEEIKVNSCFSNHNNNYKYYINQLCEEPNFDGNLDKVCVAGLHYCLSKENVLNYAKSLRIW